MVSVTQMKEDLDYARQLIYAVDLDAVINRLVKIESWSQKDAIAAVQQYRNYLFLRKKYPDHNLPPSIDIDDVWHAHVLHTKEYRTFCKEVFHNKEDKYLDHDPHLGREGSAEKLAQLFERNTNTLSSGVWKIYLSY